MIDHEEAVRPPSTSSSFHYQSSSLDMPEKYHIKTKPVPPRRPRIGKYGVVDWREDCARCHNCVKKACVYDRYRQEAEYIRKLESVDALFFDCMGCFSCVQNCTKGLLRLFVNPVYETLGNSYWKPDIIKTTWLQAETAKIPVSGAGYRGPFSGPGFDAMWTDMSEIVRPTRDGIHGREYISTAVDIGRKPPYLTFDGKRIVPRCGPSRPHRCLVPVDPDAADRRPDVAAGTRCRSWSGRARGGRPHGDHRTGQPFGLALRSGRTPITCRRTSRSTWARTARRCRPQVAGEDAAGGDRTTAPTWRSASSGSRTCIPNIVVAVRVALDANGRAAGHRAGRTDRGRGDPCRGRRQRQRDRRGEAAVSQGHDPPDSHDADRKGHPGRNHAHGRRRHRAAGAHGQGHHLRRRPGHHQPAAADRAGMSSVRQLRAGHAVPGQAGGD